MKLDTTQLDGLLNPVTDGQWRDSSYRRGQGRTSRRILA